MESQVPNERNPTVTPITPSKIVAGTLPLCKRYFLVIVSTAGWGSSWSNTSPPRTPPSSGVRVPPLPGLPPVAQAHPPYSQRAGLTRQSPRSTYSDRLVNWRTRDKGVVIIKVGVPSDTYNQFSRYGPGRVATPIEDHESTSPGQTSRVRWGSGDKSSRSRPVGAPARHPCVGTTYPPSGSLIFVSYTTDHGLPGTHWDFGSKEASRSVPREDTRRTLVCV